MNDEILEVFRSEIATAIKLNVNGKIDGIRADLTEYNMKHERDMERMMPIIETFEEWQHDKSTVIKAGKGSLWIAGAITAIGGAYIVLRQIFAD